MKNSNIYLSLLAVLMVVLPSACTKVEDTIGESEPVNKAAGISHDHNGASSGVYAVSDGVYVRFAQGNLQYNAGSGLWRFAEQQYDFIGIDNERISATYNGWIDLFGWGTSGWNSGATCYMPYSTSPISSLYVPNGNPASDIAGTQADWGVHNAIGNGGNFSGMWRTLTEPEWDYLFNNGAEGDYGRAGLWGTAIVGSTPGVVLLPNRRVGADGITYLYELPADIVFVAGQGEGWATNEYDLEQWSKLERSGAVFLPAAQYRLNTAGAGGTGVASYVNIVDGYYWSSTHSGVGSAGIVRLTAPGKVSVMERNYGLSVRLVKNHE